MPDPASASDDEKRPSARGDLPARPLVHPVSPLKVAAPAPNDAEKMLCERCGKAEMYRMHAVWRCPACGFKTDCCGW